VSPEVKKTTRIRKKLTDKEKKRHNRANRKYKKRVERERRREGVWEGVVRKGDWGSRKR